MAIKIPGTLIPSNPTEFKVVDASHVAYSGRELTAADEGSLYQIVKELHDTVNANPTLQFNTASVTTDKPFFAPPNLNLNENISLSMYMETKAPGYCTYLVERINMPADMRLETFEDVVALEQQVLAGTITKTAVARTQDFPGSNTITVGMATTVGEIIYRVSAVDGLSRPAKCVFADTGDAFAGIYYKVTCGSLQLQTSFANIAAKSIFSFGNKGIYVNESYEDGNERRHLLAFPAEIAAPKAGYIWLRYCLRFGENAKAPTAANQWKLIGLKAVNAGEVVSYNINESAILLSDLYFTESGAAGVGKEGKYTLFVESVLTADETAIPTGSDTIIEKTNTLAYTLEVLPDATVSIAATADMSSLLSQRTTNSTLSIPLVAKTNISALQGPNSLETICVLYKCNESVPNDLSAAEIITFGRTSLYTLNCSHTSDFAWNIGALPAGTYLIELYCAASNRSDKYSLSGSTTAELRNALNSYLSSITYNYGKVTSPVFTITQAVGEGAYYAGELETDRKEEHDNLLFNFEATNVDTTQTFTSLTDTTGKYKLNFNTPTRWAIDAYDETPNADLNNFALKRNQYAYLTKANGEFVDIWGALYDFDTATGSYANKGLTIEMLFKSDCIGILNSHALSLTEPQDSTVTGATPAMEGLYISYNEVGLGDSAEEIKYPLLEGVWQHLTIVFDREIREPDKEYLSNGKPIVLGMEDINPLATMRVYLNGTLVQVKTIATSSFQAANRKTFPFILNAAFDPENSNNKITSTTPSETVLEWLTNSVNLTSSGTCQFSLLRCYKTPLHSTRVYNNYLNAIPAVISDAVKEKHEIALDSVYFIKNKTAAMAEVDEAVWERRQRWYAQQGILKGDKKALSNDTFSTLHTIRQKYTSGDTKGSKNVLVNCTMYYSYKSTSGDILWGKETDVDVFLQGTSSLEYPVKNYQIKVYDGTCEPDTTKIINKTAVDKGEEAPEYELKRKKKKILPPGQNASTGWYVKDYIYTLKCDYMEHSHRNNTPTACYYQDRVIEEVITYCHDKNSVDNYLSPARQIVRQDSENGNKNCHPYRDAIDGNACVVYYSDHNDSDTNLGSWDADRVAYVPGGGENYAGSFMFNVDKEGAQLGFEIDEHKDALNCISYEGGTNDNNSAAAFIPLRYSYYEYVKDRFNSAPTNYLAVQTGETPIVYYRYDREVSNLSSQLDKTDIFLFTETGVLNSDLVNSLTTQGGRIVYSEDSDQVIESEAAFNSSTNSALYLSYLDYLESTFKNVIPTYKKVRGVIKNVETLYYFHEDQLGTYSITDATDLTTGMFSEGSYGALAYRGALKIVYEAENGTQSTDTDNVQSVQEFISTHNTKESDYIEATLEPRFKSDDVSDDDQYAPIKTAIEWVYQNADNELVFTRDFSKYFSFEYCLAYYLQMHLFAQVDNAGKNAMFDIWGPKGDTLLGIGQDADENAPLRGLGRLFPRPYDMDTQMGLDNSGADVKSPSVELHIDLSPSSIEGDNIGPVGILGRAHSAVSSWKQSTTVAKTGTRYNQYNTSESKLWKTFGRFFKTEIQNAYAHLRNTGVYSVDSICNYIDSKTYDLIGEKIYNRDAAQKYLNYQAVTTSGTVYSAMYYKCVQGNRRNRYRTFLDQRIIFLDSYFEYTPSDTNVAATLYSDLVVRSNAVQPISPVGIQVYSPQYIHVVVDGDQADLKVYVDPKDVYYYQGQPYNGILLNVPTTGNDKNMFIYGAGNIQAVRHLEDFYLNKCLIGNAAKLSEINLSKADALKELEIKANTYLRSIDLQGDIGLTSSVDLSGCTNLETVNIANSGISSLDLPAGANLSQVICTNAGIHTLKLKDLATITNANIDITGCKNLSTIELVNCENLTNFDFTPFRNKLANLTISGCPGISELNLTNFNSLKQLVLSSDTITKLNLANITSSVFQNLNLAGCRKLTELTLNNTGTGNTKYPGRITVLGQSTFKTLNLQASTVATFSANPTSEANTYDFDNITFNSGALSCANNTGVKVIKNLKYTGSLASLFYNCTSLTKITSCDFTSTGTSMNSMFSYCSALSEISNINWSLNSITTASSLFNYCGSLTGKEWRSGGAVYNVLHKMPNVTNLTSFSYNCDGLDGTIAFDLFSGNPELTTLSSAFYSCGNLGGIGESTVKSSSKITDQKSLFNECASTLTNVQLMFGACGKLDFVPYHLFSKCTALTNYHQVFYSCGNFGKTANTRCMLQATPTNVGSLASGNKVRYFPEVNDARLKKVDISVMFCQNTYTRIADGALATFFEQLGDTLADARYSFYRCGINSGVTFKIPAGLFAHNTNLLLLDGAFAGANISCALPHSIFCTCDSCKTSNTEGCIADTVMSLLSARGLFAGCTKLTGTVSNSFFKRTPAIRLLGMIKYTRSDSTAPRSNFEGTKLDALANNADATIQQWSASNQLLDTTYLRTGGMFANTGINAFESEFLAPLEELLDVSGLFAQFASAHSTLSSSSNITFNTKNVTARSLKMIAPGETAVSVDNTKLGTIFANNTKLQDASYAFCNTSGLSSLPINLFESCKDKIKDLTGLFASCTTIEQFHNGENEAPDSALSIFINNKPKLTSTAGLFADLTNLEMKLDGDLFAGCSSLSNCAGMFLRNLKLTVGSTDENGNKYIPASLFNSCRQTLSNTSYMFAGCTNLEAYIGAGYAILNDPMAAEEAYLVNLEQMTGLSSSSEAFENARQKMDNKDLLSQAMLDYPIANTSIEYLTTRRSGYRTEFTALFKKALTQVFNDNQAYKDAYKTASTFIQRVANGLIDIELAADYYNTTIKSLLDSDAQSYVIEGDKVKISGTRYCIKRQYYYYEELYRKAGAELTWAQFEALPLHTFSNFYDIVYAIDNILVAYPNIKSKTEFLASYNDINVKQCGLLADCKALANVAYMFANCRQLFGPIPADLFYNYVSKYYNTRITSLNGLFDSCHRLTLCGKYTPPAGSDDGAGGAVTKLSPIPSCVAYRPNSQSETEYETLTLSTGGNYSTVYPKLNYVVTEEDSILTWTTPTVDEVPKHFVPEDWLKYLSGVNSIQKIFNSVGIVRFYPNNTTYSGSKIITLYPESISDPACSIYPDLILSSTLFESCSPISNANYAFCFTGTLAGTVLNSSFLTKSISNSILSDVAYIFNGSSIKGFTEAGGVFEHPKRGSSNGSLIDARYAFFGANTVPRYNLGAVSSNLDAEDYRKYNRLFGYAPRFYDKAYFTNLTANSSVSADRTVGSAYLAFASTNVSPYFVNNNGTWSRNTSITREYVTTGSGVSTGSWMLDDTTGLSNTGVWSSYFTVATQ